MIWKNPSVMGADMTCRPDPDAADRHRVVYADSTAVPPWLQGRVSGTPVEPLDRLDDLKKLMESQVFPPRPLEERVRDFVRDCQLRGDDPEAVMGAFQQILAEEVLSE